MPQKLNNDCNIPTANNTLSSKSVKLKKLLNIELLLSVVNLGIIGVMLPKIDVT